MGFCLRSCANSSRPHTAAAPLGGAWDSGEIPGHTRTACPALSQGKVAKQEAPE